MLQSGTYMYTVHKLKKMHPGRCDVLDSEIFTNIELSLCPLLLAEPFEQQHSHDFRLKWSFVGKTGSINRY